MKKQNLVETPKRIYDKRADLIEKILSEELGERYVEYRKKWIKASKRELVTDFPLYLQIEHSGKCNLRCPFCIQGIEVLRKNYSRGLKPMDVKLYKKILAEAEQYNCPSISFHNNDEPLLLNDLETRIQLAKEAGFFDVILVTNATLLTKERTHNLLKLGITKMSFSVDACQEEDYKKTRRGGDFKRVLENIEYFLKQKKKSNLRLPTTRATCVLNKFTCKNMEKFRKFWEKRVDVVEFQNFQAIKNYTEGLRPPESRIDSSFTCNAPWQQLVIRPNGDILPCCSFYSAGMVVGNVKDSSLHDSWHSSRMEKIRKELSRNNFSFSPVCKMCSETFYTF